MVVVEDDDAAEAGACWSCGGGFVVAPGFDSEVFLDAAACLLDDTGLHLSEDDEESGDTATDATTAVGPISVEAIVVNSVSAQCSFDTSDVSHFLGEDRKTAATQQSSLFLCWWGVEPLSSREDTNKESSNP